MSIPMTALVRQFETEIQSKEFESLKEKFDLIKPALLQSRVVIHHFRELYDYHEKIIGISRILRGSSSRTSVTNAWYSIIRQIEFFHEIYFVGRGIFRSINSARSELHRSQSYTVRELDRKDAEAINEAANSIFRIDRESMGTGLRPGFIRRLLTAENSRCLIIKDQYDDIGYIHGVLSNDKDASKTFHVWSFARRADIGKIDIARPAFDKLVEVVRREGANSITLRVDEKAHRLIDLYKSFNFTTAVIFAEKQARPGSIYMRKRLNDNARVPTDSDQASSMRRHAIRAVGVLRVIWFEIIRQITLLFQKLHYRETAPIAAA